MKHHQLANTLEAYSSACNYVTEFVLTNYYLKQTNLNKNYYNDLWKRFGFSKRMSRSVIVTVNDNCQKVIKGLSQPAILESLGHCKITIDIYDSIRLEAWKLLINNGLTSLPVDLMKIAHNAGIKIVKDSDVKLLKDSECGRCVFVDFYNCWFIVIDDSVPIEEKRFIIAHELGHIFLWHELTKQSLWSLDEKEIQYDPEIEKQADLFAIHITAPLPKLRALRIHSALEIANKCIIPPTIALFLEQYILKLQVDEDMCLHTIEHSVYELFKNNIELMKKRTC